MISKPKLSIIIVNWDGKHHLEVCLSSLRTQTFQDFDVWLIDNGSQDGSVPFVQENFPEVKLVQLSENFGFCYPNNLGIERSKSEYVCLLNNDTELDSHCLEIMLKVAEEDPSIGVCDATQVLFDQRDKVFSTGADLSVVGSIIRPSNVDFEEQSAIQDRFIGMAACVIYKRDMLNEIGTLDNDFFAGREDVDLSFRAHLAGYRVVNARNALCYHKVSATRGQSSVAFVRRGQRNLHWVYFKNMPNGLLLRYFVSHLIYSLVTGAYFFRVGRGRAWLMSKVDVLRSLPDLFRKRREIQKLRKVSNKTLASKLTKNWMLNERQVAKILSTIK